MQHAFVLCVSLAIAALLYRGLEPWRPEGATGRLSLMVGGAIVSPIAIAVITGLARAQGGEAARFFGFGLGVILIGYMFVAGAWSLRYLADEVALRRS